jgi:hypothetical protein
VSTSGPELVNYRKRSMRLGRIILASLTALAASYSYAQTLPRPVAQSESLRLLQAVTPLFVSVGDSASVAPADSSTSHVVFTLAALVGTPLVGSLCLVSSFAAVNLSARRHQRILLRC